MYPVKTSQNEKWIDRELSRVSLFQIGLVIEMRMLRGVQSKAELEEVESYPVWEDCSESY